MSNLNIPICYCFKHSLFSEKQTNKPTKPKKKKETKDRQGFSSVRDFSLDKKCVYCTADSDISTSAIALHKQN